jgi:hypothetical protein
VKARKTIRRLLLATSIVYAAGVCLLWGRSHFKADEVCFHLGKLSPPMHIEISSGNGILHTDLNYREPYIGSLEVRFGNNPIDMAMEIDQLEALGGGNANDRFVESFCWRSGRTASGNECFFVNAPHWLALAVCFPIWLWFLYRRLSQLQRKEFCHACGYNLTGNVSGVCPECGTPTKVEMKPIRVRSGNE